MSTPNSTVQRNYLVLVVGALVITLLTGVLYGRMSQRWGATPDLLAKARHLESFPKEIGDWLLLSEDKLDELVIETLSCAGYVNRAYVNRKTGENITMAIYVGPGGPISVHTPEVCYSSQAYSIEEPRKAVTLTDVKGTTQTFWQVTFKTNNLAADQQRVYYAWSTGGEWKASNLPRFEYGGRGALYKLQMATIISAEAAGGDQDSCKNFLTELLRSGWSLEG